MVLVGERRRCYEHRAKTQASKSIFHLMRLVRFALDGVVAVKIEKMLDICVIWAYDDEEAAARAYDLAALK
ncbi:uncharacterized protein G2W53_021955 [Senna tora]|uniref:Uncharacterized protein n=1 Tax=Senna tora TaxID=362788 RepID=A0A834TMU5_9FABA|nr:uncharacterized protein G2W53_021955 [Senna tora]